MNYSFSSSLQFTTFIETLKQQLVSELPGVNSHIRLAPEFRVRDLIAGQVPSHALESAVLIVLYPHHSQLHTAVILRNEYNGTHSGQISLPGGKAELSDLSFEHTALREAQEEIGINPDKLEIIGSLSRFYVQPSNFIIYPFIAFTSHRPNFKMDPFEVQRIIEINIFEDLTYEKIQIKTIHFQNNLSVAAPGFPVGNEFMWGATAMIFSELIQVLTKVLESIEFDKQN